MSITFFDIEGDSFLYDATTIHCIVAKKNNFYYIYLSEDIGWKEEDNQRVYYAIKPYLQTVLEGSKLCAHNALGYDLPLLNKLHGYTYQPNIETIVDTAILSRLFNPDREGHSLEWWGNKLGFPKGEYNDFSKLTREMVDYCIRDVDVLERVYNSLMQEAEGWDWTEAIKLEYNVQYIQTKQEMHGVLFDVEKAEELLVKLEDEITSIETQVQREIPMTYKDMGEVKKVFNKDGSYTKSVLTWLGDE